MKIDSEKILINEREVEVAEMATNSSAVDPLIVGPPETGQNQSGRRRNNESARFVGKDESDSALFENLN